jgi:hypothetical protein
VRLVSAAVALLAFVPMAHGQSREIIGQLGVLGEWELTATVREQIGDRLKEYSGPVTLRHVGVCTQDGPEEKTGTLRLRLFEPSGRVDATLLIEGAECTFKASRAGSYDGVMNCPEKRSVPLMLWIK